MFLVSVQAIRKPKPVLSCFCFPCLRKNTGREKDPNIGDRRLENICLVVVVGSPPQTGFTLR